jgi:hypothetical protein
MDSVRENICRVREKMEQAAVRAGRSADAITLLAVTKALAPEWIEEAIAAGIPTFGESKVQEARQKISLVSGRARWHMIGHLQTNKAPDAIELFELIHSVDSVKLAGELNKWAERAGKTQRILLEVNVSGEASKFGLKPDALESTLERTNAMPRLEVQGLMTVAPFGQDKQKARPYFRQLHELGERFALKEFSMGMSHDFEVAIEEGATLVRIGTAIFGERMKAEG